MCTSTNCQVTFARKTGVNFPPLWSSVSTPIWGLKFQVNKKNNMWFIVFGSPVYMMLRLFFTAHNGTYLWLILRVFCFLFYDWGYFQDVVPLLIQAKKKNREKKVLFLWDLKMSQFQSSNSVSQWGKKTYKGFWIKMYSPPCFANSVSQISNNTGSLQHHREVSNGLLQKDIKGAAEKQTRVRVPCQIQTVRISRAILSGELPAR